jgi:hypothetical protein
VDHRLAAQAHRTSNGGISTVSNNEPSGKAGPDGTDPRPAAVTFVTTEHFTLQGARSATISESTGRASMFLSSVSGGLVALGLIATATRVGVAFYAFALILLPTLAFLGLATFDRVLQSGIEDQGYARRIARLRGYYFDNAPEVTPTCSVSRRRSGSSSRGCAPPAGRSS